MNSQPVSDQMALLRILDAAANRTREGLRVVEDWVRFALDDAHLTECLKQIRHDLAAALAGISWEQRLAARETQADVGTGITTPSEHSRERLSDVLTANFLRLQEGLRSLEEFGKIIDPAVGEAIEQIRYRTYTVQRAIDVHACRAGAVGRRTALRLAGWAIECRGIRADGPGAGGGRGGCPAVARQAVGRPRVDRPCPAFAAVDAGDRDAPDHQ